MVTSIVKWFEKGDNLTQEVRNALKGMDISNLTRNEIKAKVEAIFRARPEKSTRFAEAKKSAIKSTLKEIVRERKTFAIAKLLFACNKSIKMQQLRKDLETYKESPLTIEQKKLEMVAEAKRIYSGIDSIAVLTGEEIAVIMKNESAIGKFLKTTKFFHNGRVDPDAKYLKSAAKTLNKNIENKLPYIIPNTKTALYTNYYTVGLDADDKTINEMRDILTNDIKRNLLNKLSNKEKEIILRVTKDCDNALSTSNAIRRFARSTTLTEANFSSEEQAVLNKLADILEPDQFKLKALALANAAKVDKKLSSNFTNIEIQLLNQIFNTQIKQ